MVFNESCRNKFSRLLSVLRKSESLFHGIQPDSWNSTHIILGWNFSSTYSLHIILSFVALTLFWNYSFFFSQMRSTEIGRLKNFILKFQIWKFIFRWILFSMQMNRMMRLVVQSIEYSCGVWRLSRVIWSCALNFNNIKHVFFRFEFVPLAIQCVVEYVAVLCRRKKTCCAQNCMSFNMIIFTFEKVWALAINGDLWREMRLPRCALCKDAPSIIRVRFGANHKIYRD